MRLEKGPSMSDSICPELLSHLTELFEDAFGPAGDGRVLHVHAPGRSEISGNHTDHEGGHVIAAALDVAVDGLARPNGTNTVRVASEGYPLIEVERNEGLDGAAKATAVDAHGSAAVQDVLGKAEGVHGGLLAAELGYDVLQIHRGAGAARARQREERVDVRGLQRLPAAVDKAVLIPVVDAAENGAIAKLLAKGGDIAVEVGPVDLAQACVA